MNVTHQPWTAHPPETDQELEDDDTSYSHPLCSQCFVRETVQGYEDRHGDRAPDRSPKHDPSSAPSLDSRNGEASTDREDGRHYRCNELLFEWRQTNAR